MDDEPDRHADARDQAVVLRQGGQRTAGDRPDLVAK
jgi:hypothetical protein